MVAFAPTPLESGALSLRVAVRRGLPFPMLLDAKDTLVSRTTPGRYPASPASTTGIERPTGLTAHDRGQAVMEFALVTPVLLLLLFGIVEVAPAGTCAGDRLECSDAPN